jgi:polyisoprenoid-binding protein YceI
MKVSMIFFNLIFFTNAFASTFHSSEKNGSINFEAVAKPAMIKIKGENPNAPKSQLTIAEDKSSLESVVELDQFKTGIDMRDDHMKEKYLETKKYPQAKLTIPALKITTLWEKDPKDLKDQDFSGTLNLHGKDVPVQGTFNLSSKLLVNAEFKIKISDYGIEVPEFMGAKVAETVTIKTQIQFEK